MLSPAGQGLETMPAMGFSSAVLHYLHQWWPAVGSGDVSTLQTTDYSLFKVGHPFYLNLDKFPRLSFGNADYFFLLLLVSVAGCFIHVHEILAFPEQCVSE